MTLRSPADFTGIAANSSSEMLREKSPLLTISANVSDLSPAETTPFSALHASADTPISFDAASMITVRPAAPACDSCVKEV